jgi:hypothetical protein
MMKRLFLVTVLVMMTIAALVPVSPAAAHQPFCETDDLTPDTAWPIRDPNISTAYYGTLESANDADYFILSGAAGQQVFLSVIIPRIEGQDAFDPVLGVMGPGLEPIEPPDYVYHPEGTGGVVIESVEASEFYEPFGNRYYWRRQEATVTLPESGDYLIAIWHPEGEVGRYTFVYGKREVMGGDYGCNSGEYWTPVGAEGMVDAPAPSFLELMLMLFSGGEDDHDHAYGEDAHDHAHGVDEHDHAHEEDDHNQPPGESDHAHDH